SHIFVFSQPTTPPPPPLLVHSVLFASSAKTKWCVPKQVSISDSSLVFGSYMPSWRPDVLVGVSFAEGRSDPSLHHAGLSDPRMVVVIHTRPFSSNIALCTLFW